MIKLYRYNSTYWRMVSFNDKLLDSGKYHNTKLRPSHYMYDKEEVERISLSRTKNHIKEICLTNGFEYFFTCTVNSINADRFSLQETQDKMKKICKKIKRKNKDFKYIFITEQHKDGAFHFHGMTKNLEVYKNEFGYYSNIDFDTLGYNSFSIINDYNRACSYITKYITKSCIKNENNQIYFCSRGLNKCETEYMIPTDLKDIFGSNVFQNNYCQMKDFDINTLSSEQKRKLYEYFGDNDKAMQSENNNITNLLQLLTKMGSKFIIKP